jgi:hypothetical protein
MVNPKISKNDDPLILMSFQLFESQRKYLDELHKLSGKNKSEILRDLIFSQMDSNGAKKAELTEKIATRETEINLYKHQLAELEAVDQRKQAAGETREQLLEQAATRMLSSLHILKFKDRGFMQIFKNNLEMINRILGSNGEAVTAEELKTITIKKAEAKELSIFD